MQLSGIGLAAANIGEDQKPPNRIELTDLSFCQTVATLFNAVRARSLYRKP